MISNKKKMINLKNLKINNAFLYYFLISSSFQFQVQGSVAGGSTPSLSQSKLGSYEIFCPIGQVEQQKIADYLDIEAAKIDQTIVLIEKSIELLQEYKTSLISNVVTGKIKVC